MGKTNVVLTGMPGCGKSTTGKLLAEKLGKNFSDTDEMIQKEIKKPLRQMVLEDGRDKFLTVQEEIILGTDFYNSVISTGGSVVLSVNSMQKFKKSGIIVYLYLDPDEIKKRLGPDRRLARDSGQSIAGMYLEREPLYQRNADITVDCSGLSPHEVCDSILEKLGDEHDR